jgi:hypothetical protein
MRSPTSILSTNALLGAQAKAYIHCFHPKFLPTITAPCDISGYDEGYCFLDFIREEYHALARIEFRNIATKSHLRLVFENHPEWYYNDERHFTMQLDRPTGFPKNHFLAHISISKQSDSALTAIEIIDNAPMWTIFGQGVNDPTNTTSTPAALVQTSAPPSTMSLTAGPFNPTPTLKFIAEFTPRTTMTFSLTNNPSLRTMLLLFESARLVNLEMDVFLDTGKQLKLEIAVSTSSSKVDRLTQQPIYTRVGGSDLGPVERHWIMPEAGFGKELRAATLGNPPPHLHFKLSGGSGDEILATVRIYLTLALAGSGVVPPINLTTHQIPVVQTQASLNPTHDAPLMINTQ